MTEEELDTLAAKVVAGLQTAVIPAALPRDIGTLLRSELGHGSVIQMHTVNVGQLWIVAQYLLSPDGNIGIELRDVNGAPFWRGTLVSE